MDALQDAMDGVMHLHRPYELGDRCTECGQSTPCRTVRLISRQRSKIQESACRSREEEGR